MTRHIVVEGSDADFERVVRRAGPASVHVVRDAADAATALLAAVSGSSLLVHAVAGRRVTDRLVDDLRRLGDVEHRTGEHGVEAELTREESTLLGRLAAGATLGGAAAELHLSRRTADRRLAAAKEKLGVATTAEAVLAYLNLR